MSALVEAPLRLSSRGKNVDYVFEHHGIGSAAGVSRDCSAWHIIAAGLLGLFAFCAPTSAQQVTNDASELQEVVVTGTLIHGQSQPTGSQLITLGRPEIEAIGASNTADLLASIPSLNSFNSAPRVSNVGSSGSTAPGLRGLPSDATLVLLNGHRLVGDTPLATYPDPTAIPSMAIERIEIVPDGASAIYGSDAVGGVINIITRKDFKGAEFSAHYGFADHYNPFDANGIMGTGWGSGSATVALGYSGNPHLLGYKRDFFVNNLQPFGSTDNRDVNCFPPSVTIGTTTYAPPGYEPGQAKCANEGNRDMLTRNRRFGVLGTLTQELGTRASLLVDAKYTDNRNDQNQPLPGSPVAISNTNPYFLPIAAAPGATSETVNYSLGGILPQFQNTFTNKGLSFTVGVDWNIDDNWRLEERTTYGWSQSTAYNPSFNGALLAAAAAGTTPDTALDPFGGHTAPSVVAGIGDYGLLFKARQVLYDGTVKVDGSLFKLPSGDVKIAIGGAFRREKYDAKNPSGTASMREMPDAPSASAVRNVTSGFVEVLLPVVGESMAVPGVRKLEFSAAERYDRYSTFGSTTNPKFGVTWELREGLSLRGSYGKSFHAPSLADTQSVDARAIFLAGFPFVEASPCCGLAINPTNTIALAGGNPDLLPERAKTYSYGIDFAPPEVRGLHVGLTYFNVTFSQQILSLINFFPFPFYSDPNLVALGINSAPTAAQIAAITCCARLQGFPSPLPSVGQILDFRRTNLTSTRVKGIDFNLAYDWKSGFGDFHAAVSGVNQLGYDVQASPGAPMADNLQNGAGAVRLQLRGEFGWNRGPYRAMVAVNRTGSYKHTFTNAAGTSAVQQIGSYTLMNLYTSYTIPRQLMPVSDLTLELNIENVFDRSPPLVLGDVTGFDVTKINPIGRLWLIGLRKRF